MRVLLLAAIVCIGWVEVGLGVPSGAAAAPNGSAPAHLLKIVAYFLQYGGLPWTRVVHPSFAASSLGGLIEAAAVFAAVRLRPAFGSRTSSLHSAGLGLIAFGLITAALAAVGRVDETAVVAVPTRYYPFAALLQLGLVLCWTSPLEGWLRRHPFAAPTCLAACATLMLLVQVPAARFLLRTSDRIRATSVAFDRKLPPPRGAIRIYPDAARAALIRGQMRVRGLATE